LRKDRESLLSEIHLASDEMLFTTFHRLAKKCGSIVVAIAAAAMPECSGQSAQMQAGNCDEGKYGDVAHSHFAGQELDLICNHKFV
jgi:hypothetical protein